MGTKIKVKIVVYFFQDAKLPFDLGNRLIGIKIWPLHLRPFRAVPAQRTGTAPTRKPLWLYANFLMAATNFSEKD